MKWMLYALFAADMLVCIGLIAARLLGADAPGELLRNNSMRLLVEIAAIAVMCEVRRG